MILFIILKVYNINRRTGDNHVCFGHLYPILKRQIFLNEELLFFSLDDYTLLCTRQFLIMSCHQAGSLTLLLI